MMPMDDGCSASEFQLKEQKKSKGNFETTARFLKITIRLLVIYKRITKVRLQTSIEGYTLTEWEI
jgi:hypothetical protein